MSTCGFCNVWVCHCGDCNVRVCVCVAFVMFVCVGGFVNYGYVYVSVLKRVWGGGGVVMYGCVCVWDL